MDISGAEYGCKYCKYKSTFKKYKEDEHGGGAWWECSVGAAAMYTHPWKTLEQAINEDTGCGSDFRHHKTDKDWNEEREYSSKRYGRKVKASGEWMDVDEYRRKAKEGLAHLDTNYD